MSALLGVSLASAVRRPGYHLGQWASYIIIGLPSKRKNMPIDKVPYGLGIYSHPYLNHDISTVNSSPLPEIIKLASKDSNRNHRTRPYIIDPFALLPRTYLLSPDLSTSNKGASISVESNCSWEKLCMNQPLGRTKSEKPLKKRIERKKLKLGFRLACPLLALLLYTC